MENVHKIWGERRRILLNDLVEIDHLFVKKDGACSIHHHLHKSNKFYVISGKIMICTELGKIVLNPNEHFTVHSPMEHQFIALEDSIMIEIAFLKINETDIIRKIEGGKIINGQFVTLKDLPKNESK